MNTKIKDIEKCTKLLTVEIPQDKVAAEFEAVYKKIGREARIPGYRAGKIPLKLLKERYDDVAKNEVLEKLIGPAYADAVREAGIAPIDSPRIEQVDIEESKPLRFSARVDIYPNVEVKRYKGLKIQRRIPEITEGNIMTTLKNLQQQGGQLVSVEEKRPLKEGDWCVCDFECRVEDKVIEKKTNTLFVMNASASLADLVSGLIGVSSGEEKIIDTELPKDFSGKEYRGKFENGKIKK